MKKLTKIAALILAGTTVFSFTACGSSSADKTESENPVDKINFVDSNGTVVSGPDAETGESGAEDAEGTAAETEGLAGPETAGGVDVSELAPGTELINLDEGTFSMYGTTYTLGVTTLQDMIDAGFPFDQERLANIDASYQEAVASDCEFGVSLDSSWVEAAVRFTPEYGAASAGECVLCWLDISLINSADVDPTSDDMLHYAFTINGITYDPSVMTQQDIFDQLGDNLDLPTYSYEEHQQLMLAPGEAGYHFFVRGSVEKDSREAWSQVRICPYNSTGADTEAANCLPVVTELYMSYK